MTGFNIQAAITAAIWSQAAYLKGPLPQGFALGVNCWMVDVLPNTDVQCLVIKEPGRTSFAFRGTDDARGWLVDASIAFHRYAKTRPGVKMHDGFYGTVSAIWPELSTLAKNAAAQGLDIYVYGHSKGAAESCIFAYRLETELLMQVKARYSFGEPRSLNRAGAAGYEALQIPTWRVLDEDDIVCRVPWRFGLYKHVGQTAFLDAWGNMALNEPWYAHIPSDIAAICASRDAMVGDHGIEKYIARLEAYKTRISGQS